MKKIKRAAVLVLCVAMLVNITACVPFAFPGTQESSGSESQKRPSLFEAFFKILQGNTEDRPEAESETGNAAERPEAESETGNASERPEEETGAGAAAEKPDTESGTGSSDSVKKEGAAGDFMPEYYHYDKADFEALLEKIKAAADGQDETALEEAYEEGYQELIRLDDLYSSSYLQYSDDVSNTEYEEEMNYTETLVNDCIDLMSTLCHEIVTDGKHESFASYLGKEVCDYFKEYEPIPDEIKKMQDRETDLVTDYYREMNDLDHKTVEINGKSWSLEDMNGEKGEELASQSPQDYLKAYLQITKQFADTVGPIYLELIQIRTKIANHYGYDNYAEYAYKEEYSRDYTVEDAEKFCSDVKENIAPLYYNTVYYGGALNPDLTFDSDVPGLLEDLGTLAKAVSPVSEKAFELLSDEKLYDLGYDEERIESSYTSVVTSTGKPYIFAHLNDEIYDFLTLTHEFGHFSYFTQKKEENYFLTENHLDLMEMHSNGFELLCTKYYDQYFGSEAGDAEAYALGELLGNVTQGCIMDEFQREVYKNPDMTMEEINQLYAKVAASYGEPTFGSEAYEWSLIPHNFESPMYYLSYAVSAVTALEIWDISQNDYSEGVKAWENLIDQTDENEGYFKTLERCALTPITETEKVNTICRDVIAKISDLSGAGGLGYGYEGFDELFPDGFSPEDLNELLPEGISWDELFPGGFSPDDFGPTPVAPPEEQGEQVA